MSNRQRYSFWTHDTVAAALLAGIGMASLQSKLDAFASELNVAPITALAHGWPMLALFAALVLLVVNSAGEAREKEIEAMRNRTNVETDLRAISDAVGDGLDDESLEEDSDCYVSAGFP